MKTLHICDGGRVEEAAAACRSRGLGIEVQGFYDPAVFLDPAQLARHRDAIRGITSVSMHGPFGDLCAGSFDPAVRQVARDRFEIAYRVARELGATDVVLHHGYVPGTAPPKAWTKRFPEFWDEFSEEKSADVRFHLENMLEHGPDLIIDVLSCISAGNVDACLDVGHTHCNSRTAPVEWVEALGDRIGYVHLHDNDGNGDQHLGLGKGTVPMLDVCHALEERAPDAVWALECQDRYIEHSLGWLQENGLLA